MIYNKLYNNYKNKLCCIEIFNNSFKKIGKRANPKFKKDSRPIIDLYLYK